MTNRGVVRHAKFTEQVAKLGETVPRLEEAIEGALYSISRQPEKDGVFNPKYGVWQARLVVVHSPADVLLFYTFNPRYIYALSAALAVDSP